jgi:hypothetical protein
MPVRRRRCLDQVLIDQLLHEDIADAGYPEAGELVESEAAAVRQGYAGAQMRCRVRFFGGIRIDVIAQARQPPRRISRRRAGWQPSAVLEKVDAQLHPPALTHRPL